jgi:hypothetical protein
LGEPGIGKSDSIRRIEASERTKSEPECRFLSFDLRGYGSEDRLIRDVFANAIVEAWVRGNGLLHLFLDSLDEGLLRIDTLATILATEISKLPVERLRLRITCRTANWPNTLETRLKDRWGKQVVSIYELAPLRRRDVEECLRGNHIAFDRFFAEVDRLHAVPLAIKPITLNFLLNTYMRSGRFPSDPVELYLEGCRILCDELNANRRETGFVGALPSDQRLAIAMRLAAVTIFANRDAIWTGPDSGEVQDEDVSVRAIAGGYESAQGGAVAVTEATVGETLGTGLFSSRGIHRMGWAHQTYAEFLAARYVFEHNMKFEQVKSLIMHSGDTEERLVPQLNQTAAWLSRMIPDISQEIVRRDPELLLLSDVSAGSAQDREALVSSLLDLMARDKMVPYNFSIRSHLGKLKHPNLSPQLRPYLKQSRAGDFSKHLAIDIARECQVIDLSDDLVTLALDKSQPLPVRINAGYATARIGTDGAKSRLRPLVTENSEEDTQDELKGCALSATWPTFLNAKELFRNLTPRKDRSLFGAYFAFVTTELPKHLKSADLIDALSWVEKAAGPEEDFAGLAGAIIFRAWEDLEDEGIADALARAVLVILRAHHGFPHLPPQRGDKLSQFFEQLSTDERKRRFLLQAILPCMGDSPAAAPFHLVFCQPPLVLRQDASWLLTLLKASQNPATKQVLAEIIPRVVDWQDRAQFEEVLTACASEAVLATTLSWLIKPVELNSPVAQSLKAQYLQEKEWQGNAFTRPLVTPPPQERINRSLERIEKGEIDAWVPLCMDLTLEPTSSHYKNEFEPSLTTQPGWKAAAPTIRSRILDAAKKYIETHVPRKEEWLGTKTFHRRDFSGYKAFQLLFEELREFLTGLENTVWRKWAAVILAYPTYKQSDELISAQLIGLAYRHASSEILSTLKALIEWEIVDSQHIPIIRRVAASWDSAIEETVLDKARDPALNSLSLGSLLDLLLSQESREARVFAESLITLDALSRPDTSERAVVAARVLIARAQDCGWGIVWPLISQKPAFGREVLQGIYYSPGRATALPDRLDETSLGELYVFLVRQYGSGINDAGFSGFVGPLHNITLLREGVLNALKIRGTPEAVEVLGGLVRDLPEQKWLKFQLLEAQAITRQRTWSAPKPREILSLGENSQSRLVQSGQQLLAAILQSLEGLQEKLHAEVPLVQFLWTPTKDGGWRPLYEDKLSDYLKIHLDDDLAKRGIILNREVRIHAGQRTDIHVDATVRNKHGDTFDLLTAIVEVKGSWNRDLESAMEVQLVDKYLRDRCRFGMYVVAWFSSDLWDRTDNRWRENSTLTMAEAKLHFEEQARKLSDGTRTIKAFVLDLHLRKP